jgi:hypothetical protein
MNNLHWKVFGTIYLFISCLFLVIKFKLHSAAHTQTMRRGIYIGFCRIHSMFESILRYEKYMGIKYSIVQFDCWYFENLP